MDKSALVLEKIKTSFNLFVSRAFEKICMELLLEEPPFDILKIGRWWSNKEEIDVAALSENKILLGECKWWNEKVGLNILEDLKRKSTHIDTQGKELCYALFSKNGFTPELEKMGSAKNIHTCAPSPDLERSRMAGIFH